MKIRITIFISTPSAKDFSDQLNKAVDEIQEKGNEVDLYYSPTSEFYSAIVFGKEKI